MAGVGLSLDISPQGDSGSSPGMYAIFLSGDPERKKAIRAHLRVVDVNEKVIDEIQIAATGWARSRTNPPGRGTSNFGKRLEAVQPDDTVTIEAIVMQAMEVLNSNF